MRYNSLFTCTAVCGYSLLDNMMVRSYISTVLFWIPTSPERESVLLVIKQGNYLKKYNLHNMDVLKNAHPLIISPSSTNCPLLHYFTLGSKSPLHYNWILLCWIFWRTGEARVTSIEFQPLFHLLHYYWKILHEVTPRHSCCSSGGNIATSISHWILKMLTDLCYWLTF